MPVEQLRDKLYNTNFRLGQALVTRMRSLGLEDQISVDAFLQKETLDDILNDSTTRNELFNVTQMASDMGRSYEALKGIDANATARSDAVTNEALFEIFAQENAERHLEFAKDILGVRNLLFNEDLPIAKYIYEAGAENGVTTGAEQGSSFADVLNEGNTVSIFEDANVQEYFLNSSYALDQVMQDAQANGTIQLSNNIAEQFISYPWAFAGMMGSDATKNDQLAFDWMASHFTNPYYEETFYDREGGLIKNDNTYMRYADIGGGREGTSERVRIDTSTTPSNASVSLRLQMDNPNHSYGGLFEWVLPAQGVTEVSVQIKNGSVNSGERAGLYNYTDGAPRVGANRHNYIHNNNWETATLDMTQFDSVQRVGIWTEANNNSGDEWYVSNFDVTFA